MTECEGSSLELQPSSTSVVTTTAQMCPGMLTCRAQTSALLGANQTTGAPSYAASLHMAASANR